jgi:hypothetical protein
MNILEMKRLATDKAGKYNFPKMKRLLRDNHFKALKVRWSQATEIECEDVANLRSSILKQVEEKLNKELKRIQMNGGGIAFRFELYAVNYDRSFKDETDQRNSEEYFAWRTSVFERDSYKCVECESKTKIQAHHIKEWAEHPEDRFDIDNGTTLCVDCHVKRHPNRENLIRKSRYRK